MKIVFILLTVTLLVSCSPIPADKADVRGEETGGTEVAKAPYESRAVTEKPVPEQLVNTDGSTVEERFRPPEGYVRTEAEKGSFAWYLRNLPLKPHGAKVKYYNGDIKAGGAYLAVLDIDTGNRDLQQCADSVIRLRAEYLYGIKRYEDIHFNFTSGFRADYSKWMKGCRISVRGQAVSWIMKEAYSDDYATFRKYLDVVFAYAGTLSLSKELKKAPVEDLRAGDVFIEGGSPGHAVIVLDTAVNARGGKLFMLAQGYMPAQDMHMLENPADENLGPWYDSGFGGTLVTPDWSFSGSQLMRFD